MNSLITDLELVELAKHGDNSAFNRLALKYKKRLVRAIAAYYALDDHTINDILQIAFEKAYRKLGALEDDGAFYKWLCRICDNAAKEYLKKWKRDHPDRTPEFFSPGRRVPKVSSDDVLSNKVRRVIDRAPRAIFGEQSAAGGFVDDSEHEVFEQDAPDLRYAPETVLKSEKIAALLGDAMGQLPEQSRKAITLYSEGLTYEEIAAEMDLQVGTVGSIISRARKALVKKLAPTRKDL